jgi:putative DNA primase/helicase
MGQAADIARALSGAKVGKQWIARCPAHDDHTPSLSIGEGDGGKVLVHCFAGCEREQVITKLRSRGHWSGRYDNCSSPAEIHIKAEAESTGQDRIRAAGLNWSSAIAATDSPVAHYLRGRAIDMAVPRSIRFHPRLLHQSGARFPAMMGGVCIWPSRQVVGVHRTWIAHDGDKWKKAPLEPNKMMLGLCRGGAVRLAPQGETLMIGEGIETCLSAMQATDIPAWAALSAAGLRAIIIPDDVIDVIVLADGDTPGESAAVTAAFRLKRPGRRIRIARAPRGCDFNDLLTSRAYPGECVA